LKFLIITIICGLLLSSTAFAGDKKGAPKTIEGRITKFEKARIVVEVINSNGTTTHAMIYMDNKIKVTIDGKEAKVSDLNQRMHVVVTMRNSLIADSIAADSGNDKKKQ